MHKQYLTIEFSYYKSRGSFAPTLLAGNFMSNDLLIKIPNNYRYILVYHTQNKLRIINQRLIIFKG